VVGGSCGSAESKALNCISDEIRVEKGRCLALASMYDTTEWYDDMMDVYLYVREMERLFLRSCMRCIRRLVDRFETNVSVR